MGVNINRSVEDRLFLESENGCGYCGFRDFRALTIHHIYHDAIIDNSYDNLIVLCHNCHNIYHQQKGITQEQIVTTKRRLILKTLTPFGINALKTACRKKLVSGNPFTLLHLVELGLLEKLEAISWIGADVDDEKIEIESEVAFKITEKGRAFFEKWVL